MPDDKSTRLARFLTILVYWPFLFALLVGAIRFGKGGEWLYTALFAMLLLFAFPLGARLSELSEAKTAEDQGGAIGKWAFRLGSVGGIALIAVLGCSGWHWYSAAPVGCLSGVLAVFLAAMAVFFVFYRVHRKEYE